MKVLLLLVTLISFQDQQQSLSLECVTELVAVMPEYSVAEVLFVAATIRHILRVYEIGCGIVPETFVFRRARDRVSCSEYFKPPNY